MIALRFFKMVTRIYLRLFPTVDFQKIIRREERRLVAHTDQTSRLTKILDGTIKYLDIGARNGVSLDLSAYKKFFSFYLCEPERKEAERLRLEGYEVIEEAIYSRKGKAKLYITAKPGSSSLLKSSRLIKYFITPWKTTVVDEQEVQTTTLEAIGVKLNINFDFVKLDTQGTEMDILLGLGDQQPLFISTEVSLLSLYEQQKTFYDLVSYLHNLGYMIGDLSISNYKAIYSRNVPVIARVGRGIPLHGEVVFIPDWTRISGQELIKKRDRIYAALMLIFGLESILRIALTELETPNKENILAALE